MRITIGALLVIAACGGGAVAGPSAVSGTPDDAGAPGPDGAGDAESAAGDALPARAVDAAADAAPPPEGDANTDCGVFPAADLDAGSGAFPTTSAAEGPSCTIVRPAQLGQNGVLHPVILWGNGTGAPTTLYEPAFTYWASYGFIVAAANATDGQGAGTPLLACLDYVMEQNATPGSAYENKVCPRAAAAGHSQGGAGAIMAGRDPRVTVTAPLMAYTRQGWGGFDTSSITAQEASPMLLLSGTLDDNAVPSVYQQPVFDTTNVPVFWANLVGADHYTTALGLTSYRATMLAWFRLFLMRDPSYRSTFYGPSCALCTDSKWIVQTKGF